MSHPIEPNPTPSQEFQARIGVPPGTHDAQAECKEWERLCGELLAERQRMREEMAFKQEKYNRLHKAWWQLVGDDYVCPYTDEELLSFVGQGPSLKELIAEIEQEVESGT